MTLRYADVPGLLVPEVEGNLTHEELVQALPVDEPRLVVHELSFASPDGTRRHAQLLIFWLPPDARELEEAYTDGFTALKEFLADVHVHLTARRADQLDYLPWPAEHPPAAALCAQRVAPSMAGPPLAD
ncbi:hypothetical protein Snoj_39360 [Streptomyces nojiriensis]|uniref:ADF-H domain-containing protein n=1 Tax=Streptomyces nojiriensis TaxID=66374 RepID=A0ABQ3SPE9_9ACTN|nr:hypothetical protein JYK04_01321 [Streptomyces nojiriensis]GGR81896.1 hypothetical protein GCM10010205_08010 [Streptomyces nojiriensis]GHI70018.1 hypothetical protein Snoj_39360 [Streptomyces nojiriensis]